MTAGNTCGPKAAADRHYSVLGCVDRTSVHSTSGRASAGAAFTCYARHMTAGRPLLLNWSVPGAAPGGAWSKVRARGLKPRASDRRQDRSVFTIPSVGSTLPAAAALVLLDRPRCDVAEGPRCGGSGAGDTGLRAGRAAARLALCDFLMTGYSIRKGTKSPPRALDLRGAGRAEDRRTGSATIAFFLAYSC